MHYSQGVWKISDLLEHAASMLSEAGVETPHTDAERLLEDCLEVSRTELYLRVENSIGAAQVRRCLAMLKRRCGREPLAYITGECEFWSYTFGVNPAVLIPRPETELLIERVARENSGRYRPGKCLDLCCGSGVIAIVLALELDLEMIALDISRAALEVCRSNCVRHGVENKVQLIEANLTSCFNEHTQFALITANPPYVSRTEMKSGMQPEVIDFEPCLALDGGRDGLQLINSILAALPALLAPGGDLFMEIGAGQGAAVTTLFRESACADLYQSIDIIKDYGGRDRLLQVRKNI
ncbi:MAG: peptide chain release factor N(5)-glutamine methyltransferase [Desulfofustis sp.]|jgi:release factor glutamine methyltransferase